MSNSPITPSKECKIVCRRDMERLKLGLSQMELMKFHGHYGTYSLLLMVIGCIAGGAFAALSSALVCGLLLLMGQSISGSALPYLVGIGSFLLVFIVFGLTLSGSLERYPEQIVINEEGFRFVWGNLESPVMPWSALTGVELEKEDFFSLPSESILLTLNGKMLSAAQHWSYWTACTSLWNTFPWRHLREFRLYMEAIPSKRDRQKLIDAIRTYAPDHMLNSAFLEASGGVHAPSHTDIWLEKMASHQNIDVLEPGTKLEDDAYEIESKLASGGQGTVYKARATEFCRNTNLQPGDKVVIKEIILPVDGGFSARQRAVKHVQAEAELLTKFDHPQIIEMHEWFVMERRAMLVIEYIEGESLRAIVERAGPMPVEQVREIALQICDIIAYLHTLEPPVVHRDFTPENVMLQSDGRIKLIDFNVAQQLEGNAGRTVVGKHAYIPPEQFKGKATPASDIYAFGATLFFLLTGEDPEPISASHPPQLTELVAQLTAPNLRDRLSDIEDIRQLLVNCGESSAISVTISDAETV